MMLRALAGHRARPSGVHPHHTRWRSLRVERSGGVEVLNGLLRAGWYVIAVNVGGVSFLSAHAAGASAHAEASHRSASVEVVLAEDGRRCRQHAVFVGRTVSGHANTAALPRHMHGWIRTLVVELGSGDALVLYEREE